MGSKRDSKGPAKVFEAVLPGHPDRLQILLLDKIFRDRCEKCGLSSYVEVESPPEIDHPDLKSEIGLACGFWLARRDFAEALCAEFEGQFEMRKYVDRSSKHTHPTRFRS